MIDSATALAWADDLATLALLHERELTPVVLAGVKAIGFPDNLGMVARDAGGAEIFAAMRESVAALPEVPDGAFIDRMAADFAAIYLNGALAASPCESFWVSDEHLLCQEAMFALRELYAADGLVVPDWRLRPDDHLVFQLQFFARRLASVGAAADGQRADECWRLLATLLDHHLLRWLPDFAERVARRCDTAFYAALCLLTDVCCQQLRDEIARHLGEARPDKEAVEAALRASAGAPAQPVHFMPGSGGPSW